MRAGEAAGPSLLHVTNGDSAANTLRQTTLDPMAAGDVIRGL